MIDVKQEGARGNGSTDDQPFIQEVVNNAPPGETIYFPPGEYKIAADIKIATDRLGFVGDDGAIIIMDPPYSHDYKMAFWVDSRPVSLLDTEPNTEPLPVYGISIENLTIRVRNGATKSHDSSQGVIQINHGVDCVVRNVRIQWDIEHWSTKPAHILRPDHVDGVVFAMRSSGGCIQDVVVDGVTKAGIYAAWASDIAIEACEARDVGFLGGNRNHPNPLGGSGISIGSSDHIVVSSCRSHHNSRNGLSIFRAGGADPRFKGSSDIQVRGGRFEYNDADGIHMSTAYKETEVPKDVQITGVSLSHNGGAGIRVEGGRNVEIDRASVSSNGASGVSISGGSRTSRIQLLHPTVDNNKQVGVAVFTAEESISECKKEWRDGPSDIHVCGGRVHSNRGYGIYIGSGDPNDTKVPQDVHVTGTDVSHNGGVGIRIEAGSNVDVDCALVSFNGASGVSINGRTKMSRSMASSIRLSRPIICNNVQLGIAIYDSDRVTVVRGYLYDDQQNPTQKKGIQLVFESTVTSLRLVDNYVSTPNNDLQDSYRVTAPKAAEATSGYYRIQHEGPPTDILAAPPCSVYVDTTTGTAFVKKHGTGSSGWARVKRGWLFQFYCAIRSILTRVLARR